MSVPRQAYRFLFGLGLAFAAPLATAQAMPEPAKITDEVLDAARAEGRVLFYTSVELELGEKIKSAFEAKFPGIRVQVERSGSERIYQRIGQEYESRIYSADVVSTSDAAHYVVWKRQGLLAPYVPEEVAQNFAPEHIDADGQFATWRASLSVLGYNTKYVKAADAPKSFADLLDPKWRGLIVKAHPGYSGSILTATYEIARDIGWSYFEKLATQKVMQVQSSVEPCKKVAIGERPIMADGSEYVLLMLKAAGSPIEAIYPTEGTPFVSSPSAILARAPHPNAARVFQTFLFSRETQQMLIDSGGLRSVHGLTKDPPGRKTLSEIKILHDDPVAVADKVDEIKATYTKYFGT